MSDIPGSRPRKLIKNTNFNNPSLISNSIKSLFDPEIVIVEQKQKIKRSYSNYADKFQGGLKRNHSQQFYNFDSLNKAEDQFLKKKLHLPSKEIVSNNINNNFQRSQSQLKSTQYRSSMNNSNISYINNFNYINFNSIKAKQSHGYDIINCRPSQKI